jgi:hypothetical protein
LQVDFDLDAFETGRVLIRQGLYAAESLLESRVDKECDKFTAWMLRNPFDFKGDKEYVLVRWALSYLTLLGNCYSPCYPTTTSHSLLPSHLERGH